MLNLAYNKKWLFTFFLFFIINFYIIGVRGILLKTDFLIKFFYCKNFYMKFIIISTYNSYFCYNIYLFIKSCRYKQINNIYSFISSQ